MEKQKMSIKKMSVLCIAVLIAIVAIVAIRLVLILIATGVPKDDLLYAGIGTAEFERTKLERPLKEIVEIPEDALSVIVVTKNNVTFFTDNFPEPGPEQHSYLKPLETMLQLGSASSNAYARGCNRGLHYECKTVSHNNDWFTECGCWVN